MTLDSAAENRFKKIKEALDFLHDNKSEWEAYDRALDAIRSQADQIKTAEMQKAIEIAKKMLGRLDINEIAEITGLTIEDLENVRDKK